MLIYLGEINRLEKEVLELVKKMVPKHYVFLNLPIYENVKGYYEAIAITIYQLCKEIKKCFPDKTIWLYTGLNFENLIKNDINKRIVELCDVIVDGPFIESLKDLKLKWRGSSNQRVIDVKKTLSKKEIVLYE